MPLAVKQLHFASNMNELKEKCVIDKLEVKKDKPVKQLVTSFEKLHINAMKILNKEGEHKDEELAFYYLYRAMELWQLVKESKEFEDDPKYFKLMHGKTVSNIMTVLDELTINLSRRYEEKKNFKEDNVDVNLEGQFQVNSSLSKEQRTKKRKEASDTKGGKNNKPVSPLQISRADIAEIELIDNYAEPLTENLPGEKKFIECKELREMILGSSQDVLVLDVRPKDDFVKSIISKAHCVNIPETHIMPGLTTNKLGAVIVDKDEKFHWQHRDQYKQVVLMDWFSEEKDVIPSCKLDVLLNILLKWDTQVIYKNRPLILNGGYERWLDTYPMLSTNAKISRPLMKPISPFIHLSEHMIEYPMQDLEEITAPKPKPVESQPKKLPLSMPVVDRSTKPEQTVEKPVEPMELEVTTEEEPMDEDKDPVENSINPHGKSPTPNLVFKERPLVVNPGVSSPPARPKTPPRIHPPVIKPVVGDGDGDMFLQKTKFDSGIRGGGLKRSTSSPNINKLIDEESDGSSKPLLPKFDRSIKPKTYSQYESFSPRESRDTDTIFSASHMKDAKLDELDFVFSFNLRGLCVPSKAQQPPEGIIKVLITSPRSNTGRGLTGLKNLGNLCYMNSIMQCISNTVELTKALTRFNPSEIQTVSRKQIASEVSSLLCTLWSGDTRITSCRHLKARVGVQRNSFATNEQQDSHEFLTILMDWLHEDLNEPSPIRTDGAVEETGEKAWGEFRKKNNSVVLDLFYGQQKSTVTCNHCHKQSIQFEPFSNLSVPLPQDSSHDRCSIEDCLRLYLKGETISGWVCPSCKTAREATKKLDITRLPPVLIIHLKRFTNDSVGHGWCRKRMNMVDFSISDFDMRPYTHPDSELRFHNYNLYAVSNHYGSMDSGHYTAYCRNHLLNKWYKFDDSDVSEMSPSDVKSSAAYILFYESDRQWTEQWSKP